MGHNNLPNFIGQYFPRRNDVETYDFYCASMLMLLKPWRVLERDLKSCNQSWTEAFDVFLASSEARRRKVHDIIAGIQYFHDCESSAAVEKEDKDVRDDIVNDHEDRIVGGEYDKDLNEDDEDIVDSGENDVFTYEALEELISSQTPLNEAIHAHFAVELG